MGAWDPVHPPDVRIIQYKPMQNATPKAQELKTYHYHIDPSGEKVVRYDPATGVLCDAVVNHAVGCGCASAHMRPCTDAQCIAFYYIVSCGNTHGGFGDSCPYVNSFKVDVPMMNP